MAANGAFAADFPAKPIRVLVGFAPGGSADIIARAVSQKLADAFKYSVVVDNRSGASGIIAAPISPRNQTRTVIHCSRRR
jgi:tripartite-type tricarboxylate transporter receptor subunit TctC